MSFDLEDRGYIQRYNNNNIIEILTEKYGEKFTAYRKEWDKAQNGYTPSKPLSLALGLTSYCNLKCKMCVKHYEDDSHIREDISEETLNKVYEEIKKLDIPSVSIGLEAENIIHPNFTEIVKNIRESGVMDIFIYTNGFSLTERIANTLIDLEIERLHVSLDAFSPETYKKIRGANLEVVERNIHKFLEIRAQKDKILPILRLSFIKMQDNMHEIDQFLGKWIDHADMVDFQQFVDVSRLNNLKKDIECENFICPDPFQKLAIGYDGSIYPCCSFFRKTYRIGYINEMSLEEAWNAPLVKNLRQGFLDGKISNLCKNCFTS